MNKDLQALLEEMGPDYQAVVARLKAAQEVEPSGRLRATVWFRRLHVGQRVGLLVAASFFAAMTLAVLCQPLRTQRATMPVYTVAYTPSAAAVAQLVQSQKADGSWENDYLTRQNAAALRDAATAESRVAYRRAVRYLRSKGLEPLSRLELRAREDSAATWMNERV